MEREITILGFLLIAIVIISSNIWAYRNPTKLVALGPLINKLMSDRSTRLALIGIWWWMGWHFLYAWL